MCLLVVFGVFIGWLSILGPVCWPFVGYIVVVRDCRLLLVHTIGGMWDIVRGVRCVFVGVVGLGYGG